MKRKISLILAVLLTLSMLAGCGGNGGETNPAAPPETTAPAVEDRPLTLGVVEGNTYTNTYAGFGCTLGEGWTMLPADQLQELPDIVKESVQGTEVGEAMKDIQQFTDMLAENVDQMTNMNVLFQKLSMQERIAYKLLSEEAIVDETLKQKDALIEAYTAMGLEITSIEKTTVTFLGEEHFAMKTVAETQGVPCYMLQVFNYGLGEYSVTMTLTSFLEDNTESMLELFYKVE